MERLDFMAEHSHGLGASPFRLEPQGADFSVERAGADASRLLRRKIREFLLDKGIPAGASGAAWPCPQTNDRIFPEKKAAYGHPITKGLPFPPFFS
jgi:hypothetical protein